MTDKVVALPGFSIPLPKGDADPEIVQMLEEMLALAKAGQMQNLAAAWTIDDGSDVLIDEFRVIGKHRHVWFALTRMVEAIRREYF